MADPALVAVVRDMLAAVMRATAAGVTTVWRNVPDLTDEAAEVAMAEVVPLVRGAQRSAAAITTTYVTRVTGLDLPTPPVGELIPAADWNRSPIIQARRLVGEGNDVVAALDLAAKRAAQVHSGDVLRARNDAAAALSAGVEELRPIRWAKSPNPLACDWCRLVATKLYFRPDGLPAHLHCRCGLNAVTPAEAGSYSNASTVFGNYRWRSRVSTPALREAQRAMAATAADLAASANAAMARAA